ncbi:MAG: transglutaminase family protein [Deltaproteobacteria bacterium]|nr:transglutaminase family protein [Deltaproteobacteria bacterium]
MSERFEAQLAASPMLDWSHSEVAAFTREHHDPAAGAIERAVRLYYAVRDGIRYDPYTSGVTRETLRASAVLEAGRSWCVGKAVLLAACCRGAGIPARLGFADVRNHLSTARLRAIMGTDVFYWHGYAVLHLEGRWVKATPAFNIELCEKFGLLPLDFDGRHDSLYHPFDREGQQHMEYVNERGEFDDPPVEAMLATWKEKYRFAGAAEGRLAEAVEGDFDREVEDETRDGGQGQA